MLHDIVLEKARAAASGLGLPPRSPSPYACAVCPGRYSPNQADAQLVHALIKASAAGSRGLSMGCPYRHAQRLLLAEPKAYLCQLGRSDISESHSSCSYTMSSGKRDSSTFCYHQELENTRPGPAFVHLLELLLDHQVCTEHPGIAVKQRAWDPAYGTWHREGIPENIQFVLGLGAEAECSPGMLGPSRPQMQQKQCWWASAAAGHLPWEGQCGG